MKTFHWLPLLVALVAVAVVTSGCELFQKNPESPGPETANNDGNSGDPSANQSSSQPSGNNDGSSGTAANSNPGGNDPEPQPQPAQPDMTQYMQAQWTVPIGADAKVGQWVEYTSKVAGNESKSRWALVGTHGDHWVVETRTPMGQDVYVMAYVIDDQGKVHKAFAGKPGTVGKPIEVMEEPKGEAEDVQNEWETTSDYSSDPVQAAGTEFQATRLDIHSRHKTNGQTIESTSWYSTSVPSIGMGVAKKEDGTVLGGFVKMETQGVTTALSGWGEDAKPELKLPE